MIFCLLSIYKISTAAVPTEGQFIFTAYKDSSCSNYNREGAGTYNGAQACWQTSNSSSIVASEWNNGNLKITEFLGSASCQGSTGQQINSGTIICDGTCSKSSSNQYYTCVYVNIPTSPNFVIKGFTDNKCKNPSFGEIQGNGSNICWRTSDTSSIVPLVWDSPNRKLVIYTFDKNPYCAGSSKTDIVGEIPCNGSCQASGQVQGTFYTCTWAENGNCSHIMISFILLLVTLMVIF